MSDPRALQILLTGIEAWNQWRKENPSSSPDLRGAGLQRAKLTGGDFSGCDLSEADLGRSDLNQANLMGADLRRCVLEGAFIGAANLMDARLDNAAARNAYLMRANLSNASLTFADLERASLQESNLANADLRNSNLLGADLELANLSGANVSEAHLNRANLFKTSLNGANLRRADLEAALMINTDLTGADLTDCRIYGVSAWSLKLEGAKQQNLIITPENEPEITVDNIEVAQFIYLLLHNEKIRDIIDTIGKKAVLILGRFTDERKAVLDAIREELRKRNFLPILFDFSVPASRDVTGSIKTLASLARFVIADVTDATEVRVELHNIVRDFTSLPIQPIQLRGQPEFMSLSHLTKFPWVLPIYEYDNQEHLLASLDKSIIAPADAKAKALEAAVEEGRRKIEAEISKPP